MLVIALTQTTSTVFTRIPVFGFLAVLIASTLSGVVTIQATFKYVGCFTRLNVFACKG